MDSAAARTSYANAVAGFAGPEVVRAFARVPREAFAGPPPWRIVTPGGGIAVCRPHEVAELYRDVLIAIAPERGINNGQPSLHAQCLAAAHPQPGDTVVQVGAGTGYYSALLAELVGPTGVVHAYEIEADLAARAAEALAGDWPQVRVRAASAAAAPLPAADVVYASAGASHPPPSWLDALKPGGRLVFPLTPDYGVGGMLLVTRLTGGSAYAARFIARVAFIDCIGARDPAAARAVAAAFEQRSLYDVRSLHRDDAPDHTLWCRGRGWWLSTAPVRNVDGNGRNDPRHEPAAGR